MRLINTKTLDLEDFFDIYVPEYAILSHTWADGEISLQEWADRKNRRFKPGYQKIIWTCEEAIKDGLEYVWVDTNCIDKTSSAELSEAINSMFKWYRRARICYAYLEDVPHMSIAACEEQGSAFRAAKWFTRGWTLQELIAPPEVKFFSHDWRAIGAKADLALCIAEITGIAWTCLLKPKFSKSNPLRGYSVAQRLSWASRRSTTRLEDQAYSLIGLFDITMPLLYGEGHDAFTRFLSEIISKYPDHSFFASQLRYVDFLPRSPKEFCNSHNVVIGNSPQLQRHYMPVSHSYPFQMTNTGLQITLPIVPTLVPHFAFGVLDCWEYDMESTQATRTVSRLWIPLLQKDHPGLRHYSRLLWPQIFSPVKLIRKHRFMQATQADGDGSDDQTAATESASLLDIVQHVDIVSMNIHQSILIKKPYASTVDAPRWQPRLAGSPFLLCFPRGTGDYRLFGIFPSYNGESEVSWSPQQPPLLPLVMPRKIQRAKSTDTTCNDEALDSDASQEELYGAVIVFKGRRSMPSKFVAIHLANVPETTDDGTTFRPSCKILHAWNPSQPKDLCVDDFQDVSDIDAKDNVFVSVQKIPCPSKNTTTGWEPRFLGLVQIVFDKALMMEELCLTPNMSAKAAEGMLQYFGMENSDDEIGNLI
ncbi:het domain-containing [Trichoderma arundinaceum]|uniref:Het domain-containing n=1 Tax=Trichoderma arundinaceum TaxID=490622 RepID=A0A395NQZ9_TRIAR|nr:het domain-containing [Trichoderma arundinaceum]